MFVFVPMLTDIRRKYFCQNPFHLVDSLYKLQVFWMLIVNVRLEFQTVKLNPVEQGGREKFANELFPILRLKSE
jgi:hypothetical protein